MAEAYDSLREEARQQEVQRSGHGGEETWARLLQAWLPPAYAVGTRKYIVPEEGDETFETDLVVFNPGYPAPLRERRDVLAGELRPRLASNPREQDFVADGSVHQARELAIASVALRSSGRAAAGRVLTREPTREPRHS
jgi:hypothetical protein